MVTKVIRRALGVSFVLAVVAGCGGAKPGSWALPAGDLSGARSASDSSITTGDAHDLHPVWRFALTGKPGASGIFASTPVADSDTIYVEDLRSNVFALDRTTGALRWAHHYNAPNKGPNGLAVDSGRVYGVTDDAAFALAAANGRELWRVRLTNAHVQSVDVSPVPWGALLFVSTVGRPPGGRGALYGLEAATGRTLWRFETTKHPWPQAARAGGGGSWEPVSVDSAGRLYAGIASPAPWGGSPELPNGAAFPGPVPYTDSLVVLDAATGKLDWTYQVTPHDVRDYAFAATPIEAGGSVFGAGKAGTVIAWNADTHERLWSTPVGTHRNDTGPLPAKRVTVCPGLLGGVETPMAYAEGRLFVPMVDLCGPGSATSRQPEAGIDPSAGLGGLAALDAKSGTVLWERRLQSPALGCATVANDVVFTATYDGAVYAFSTGTGRELWHARMPAGIDSCPSVVGNLLLVGAGVRLSAHSRPELVAFAVPTGR